MYITEALGTHLKNMENNSLTIMLQRIASGWNLARLLRVFVGGAILFSSLQNGEWAFAILALFVLATGLFNIGCAGSCSTGYTHTGSADTQTHDVEFEEVNTK